MNVKRPDFQRYVEKNKVNDIICYQLEFYKTYQYFNFAVGGPLNLHHFNGEYYLVDGQHRFSAIERLYFEHSHTPEFQVLIVDVSSEKQLRENYDMINKNTPLPDFSDFTEIDKKVPEKVAGMFQDLFATIWSKNSRARKPHMFFNYFQESLAYICQEAKITDAGNLFKIVSDYNKILSKWEPNSFKKCSDKQYLKCKATRMYLGLMDYEHQEPYGYLWAKKIKNDAWDRCFGAEQGTATCPCCQSTVIDAKNHDAGHIISEKNGGMVTVDNIVPICRGCNLSMGTINMPDYMKRHQPGNPQDFMNISTLIHTD